MSEKELAGLGPLPVFILNEKVAVQDIDVPHYNNVLWWHLCEETDRWVPSGLGRHSISGSVKDQNLTVSASILCTVCGRHGFIENLTWREA